jgi:hypothetical protein
MSWVKIVHLFSKNRELQLIAEILPKLWQKGNIEI